MSPAASYFERSTQPPNRRLFARQQVRSLAYVELDKGNGGIILNVGEGGMAIQAVMSLSGNELPELRVQLAHSKKQIQAKGRIAWMGELRKLAGVEFLDLPEETRAQIREWVSLETPAQAADPSPEKSSQETALAASGQLVKPAGPALEPSAVPTRFETGRPLAAPPSAPQFSAVEAAGLRRRASRLPDAAAEPAFSPETRTNAAPAAAAPPVSISSSQPDTPAPADPASSFVAPATTASRLAGAATMAPALARPPRLVAPAVQPSSPLAQPDATVEPTAPATSPRDRAELPADRFGFRPAAPQPAGSAVSREGRDGWKLTPRVGVFVIVSLAAGWVAGHGVLRRVLPKVAGNALDGGVAAESALARPVNSANVSEIEILDLNNQRWTIPMQGSTGSVHSRQFDSPNSRSRQSATNFREATQPRPVQPQDSNAETKTNPPVLTPSSSEPENVLPQPQPGDARRGTLAVPPPGSSSDGLQAGELMDKVEPDYPPEAMEQRVEGTVRIYVVIGEDGNIKRAQALSGPPLLIPAALRAVRQWHYRPTLLHGQPIETQRQITVVFQLAKPTPQ